MIYDINGLEDGHSINVEAMYNKIIEIYTDNDKVCCLAIVKLDINGVDELIGKLQRARKIINNKGE